MIEHAELEHKRRQIDAIRRLERDLPGMDAFRRGQLSGAQQTLYWATGQGMEPVRTILTDEQIAAVETAQE